LAESAKSTDANRKPGLPAPRKPGGCLKFQVQEMGAAVLVSTVEPVFLQPQPFLPRPAIDTVQCDLGPVRMQPERPPPLGLIFAESKNIRI
jgi:hypothetical protein